MRKQFKIGFLLEGGEGACLSNWCLKLFFLKMLRSWQNNKTSVFSKLSKKFIEFPKTVKISGRYTYCNVTDLWYLAVKNDHFSRYSLGISVFSIFSNLVWFRALQKSPRLFFVSLPKTDLRACTHQTRTFQFDFFYIVTLT